LFRLTGTYAYLIFFLATVLRHTDTGPYHTGSIEADQCSSNPWTNLLYINNFNLHLYDDKADGSCLGQTWYLANDMQFFFFAPPIVYIMWKWKKIGLALIGFEIFYQIYKIKLTSK
jgi:peptidoglycan/LPS O-acetylase OafA/YrhL